MTRCIYLTVFLLLMFFSQAAEAVKSCPTCAYRLKTGTVECPKCLRLLEWPFQPPRERKARVIIRTGTDAFIRSQHAENRAFKHDRNAGSDLQGAIGSWGGPTTLRYLVRFDIPMAFSQAGVELKGFKLRRALLRLKIAGKGNLKGSLPVRIYPLTRPFKEGSDKSGTRKKFIDGCTWVYAAPYMVWHREGGDYNEDISCRGTLPETGEAVIDVTDIFKERLARIAENEAWYDPGMIIMRDPHAFGDFGYLEIYSFESRAVHGSVRSPELFIE